jgi:hypothetical protein
MGYSNGRPVLANMRDYEFHDLVKLIGSEQEVILKKSRMQVKLVSDHSSIQVVLGDTPIVTHHPNGSFTLDNGGWYTPITAMRMTEFTPPGYSVWKQDHFWYVDSVFGTFPFARGLLAGPAGIANERASWPQHTSFGGKRYPLFTVAEYTDRAYTTLAYWLMGHVWYLDSHVDTRFRDRVVSAIRKIEEVFDDLASADNGFDYFTAAMRASNLVHVGRMFRIGNENGHIVNDYGRGRGLRRRVVQLVSDGPDRYFGQEQLDKFYRLEEDELPPLPVFTYRKEIENE